LDVGWSRAPSLRRPRGVVLAGSRETHECLVVVAKDGPTLSPRPSRSETTTCGGAQTRRQGTKHRPGNVHEGPVWRLLGSPYGTKASWCSGFECSPGCRCGSRRARQGSICSEHGRRTPVPLRRRASRGRRCRARPTAATARASREERSRISATRPGPPAPSACGSVEALARARGRL